MSILAKAMPALLKTNLNRTVLRDREANREIVVKRFHSPGALRRLADGRRAAREFEVLSGLHERGLPVPEPLELRKRDEHWEVVSAWIPNARPLEDFLRGGHAIPPAAGDLARRLARLLARTWSTGLVHSDLHAGNVLLDEAGEAWLIDFQHAQIRTEVSLRRRINDLVVLSAEVRELVSARFRARFMVELLRNLDTDNRTALGARTALAQRVEEEARLHHRHRVHRRQLRWTRESSSCREFDQSPMHGWVNREFEVADDLGLKAIIGTPFDQTSTLLSNGFEILEIDHPEGNWILVRAQEESVLREAWYTAVRVQDHGLPGPTPCLFLDEPEPRALFRERPNGHYLTKALALRSGNELLSPLMHLLGGLHDRGLALADLSLETFRAAGREVSFGTPLEIIAATPSRRARDRKAARELIDGDGTSWADAYFSAWRGDRAELVGLREEIERD